jgi:ammonium transporter, Amt family
MSGIIMGLIGGVICFFSATTLKHAFGYDDSLDAFGVHGVGGTLGALLTGVFATKLINPNIEALTESKLGGIMDGNPKQFLWQLIATLVTWAIAVVGAFVLLKLTQAIVGLRVTEEEEYDGLDITQHGESGYTDEDMGGATLIRDSIDMSEREEKYPTQA